MLSLCSAVSHVPHKKNSGGLLWITWYVLYPSYASNRTVLLSYPISFVRSFLTGDTHTFLFHVWKALYGLDPSMSTHTS